MSAPASAPDGVRLFGPEVHRLRVSAEMPRLEQHWRHLDSAERQRADRFRNEADRARFVIARSSLRQLLARRIGIASGEIRFGENEFGKPLLQHAPVALHFNSSHSGDWVLHAIDSVAPIGIDVEAVRADLALYRSIRTRTVHRRIGGIERGAASASCSLLCDGLGSKGGLREGTGRGHEPPSTGHQHHRRCQRPTPTAVRPK